MGYPPEKGRPQALKRGDKGTLIGTAEAVPLPVADVSRFIAGTSAALQAKARVVHERRRLRRRV